MNRIEALRVNYARYVSLPWDRSLPGAQRIWFAVYDPADDRKLRLLLPMFEIATKDKDTGEIVSKIVPQLRPGSAVTLTRTDVMYVATEYGVVNLKGKSLRERAQALISITHPDFRGELRQYAKDVKYFVLPEHEVW